MTPRVSTSLNSALLPDSKPQAFPRAWKLLHLQVGPDKPCPQSLGRPDLLAGRGISLRQDPRTFSQGPAAETLPERVEWNRRRK